MYPGFVENCEGALAAVKKSDKEVGNADMDAVLAFLEILDRFDSQLMGEVENSLPENLRQNVGPIYIDLGRFTRGLALNEDEAQPVIQFIEHWIAFAKTATA